MNPAAPFHEVCCASLPAEQVTVLADVRDLPGVAVALADGRAWVRWETGDERVLRRLLPVPGVELYLYRDGHWYRHGKHLPAFDLPQNLAYRPLHAVVTPAPVLPLPAPSLTSSPVPLALVPSDRPQTATALRCGPAELERWADSLPSGRLAELRAARGGDRVLVLGPRLPLLSAGERYWGDTLLLPLGFRVEPELPASAVRAALGVAEDELLLLGPDGAEAVARAVFQPLRRAQLRLLLQRRHHE